MADFSRRVPLDELRGRGLVKGLQPEILDQISSWPSGAVIFAVDASGAWSLAGNAWGPVETDPAGLLFLGASRPTSPVAEVTAIASVLRMLRAARMSIPLIVLSDLAYALGVVSGDERALTELPLV